jgi:hypothetical protein
MGAMTGTLEVAITGGLVVTAFGDGFGGACFELSHGNECFASLVKVDEPLLKLLEEHVAVMNQSTLEQAASH